MTDKEAIKELQDRIDISKSEGYDKMIPEYVDALKLAVKGLKKQIEYKWHDLEEDPKDLPEPYEMCQLIGYGSDFIVAKEGETLEQAILRIQQTEWHRLGSIDEEGFWNSEEGYPMMVSPRYWKRLDWSRDE